MSDRYNIKSMLETLNNDEWEKSCVERLKRAINEAGEPMTGNDSLPLNARAIMGTYNLFAFLSDGNKKLMPFASDVVDTTFDELACNCRMIGLNETLDECKNTMLGAAAVPDKNYVRELCFCPFVIFVMAARAGWFDELFEKATPYGIRSVKNWIMEEGDSIIDPDLSAQLAVALAVNAMDSFAARRRNDTITIGEMYSIMAFVFERRICLTPYACRTDDTHDLIHTRHLLLQQLSAVDPIPPPVVVIDDEDKIATPVTAETIITTTTTDEANVTISQDDPLIEFNELSQELNLSEEVISDIIQGPLPELHDLTPALHDVTPELRDVTPTIDAAMAENDPVDRPPTMKRKGRKQKAAKVQPYPAYEPRMTRSATRLKKCNQ